MKVHELMLHSKWILWDIKVKIKLREKTIWMGSVEGGIRSREKQKVKVVCLFSLEQSIVLKVLDIG